MLARFARKSTQHVARKYTSTTRTSTNHGPQISQRTIFIGSAAAAVAVASWYITTNQYDASAASSKALDPKSPQFVDFKVSEVQTLNHNTKLIRFELEKDQQLGLPVASCVVVKMDGVNDKDGKPVIRPYTPLDGDSTGFFDLLVKKYDTGALTPHLTNVKPGDKVSVKGPIAKLPYEANSKKKIGMIAGGTGLTPMLQVAQAILRNPDDKTEVTFVFANIAEEDILLKKQIDEMAAKHKNFKVHYVLEKPPKGWNGSVGFVNKDVVQKFMPAPSNDNLVLVCGPPGMMKAISGSKAPDYSQGEVDGILKDLGYTKEQVYKF